MKLLEFGEKRNNMDINNNLSLNDIIYFCEIDKFKKIESWKEIPGYEGKYSVSDLGRIKSLKRIKKYRTGIDCIHKEKILKPTKSGKYLTTGLTKNLKKRTFSVHVLVAMAFLGHRIDRLKHQVDHIKEGDKTDNRLLNIQILTPRENSTKYTKQFKFTSKYVGVYKRKKSEKWHASISINNKRVSLGSFQSEIDAHNAYQNKLKSLKNN